MNYVCCILIVSSHPPYVNTFLRLFWRILRPVEKLEIIIITPLNQISNLRCYAYGVIIKPSDTRTNSVKKGNAPNVKTRIQS
nr:MAG TPA: hypothetical protein [Caudoviricetes sp.]